MSPSKVSTLQAGLVCGLCLGEEGTDKELWTVLELYQHGLCVHLLSGPQIDEWGMFFTFRSIILVKLTLF